MYQVKLLSLLLVFYYDFLALYRKNIINVFYDLKINYEYNYGIIIPGGGIVIPVFHASNVPSPEPVPMPLSPVLSSSGIDCGIEAGSIHCEIKVGTLGFEDITVCTIANESKKLIRTMHSYMYVAIHELF